MKIAIGQMNPIVGDIRGNVEKIKQFAVQAALQQAELVIFPELSITGYFPKDLLHHDDFILESEEAIAVLQTYARELGIGILIGNIRKEGASLYNSAFLLGGSYPVWQDKTLLPTYDVFDEYRYFMPTKTHRPLLFKGTKLGVHICEDSWFHMPSESHYEYLEDPVAYLASQGAHILINLSASPYQLGKAGARREMMGQHRYDIPYVYVNQVGGIDELIFDGRSTVLDRNGNVIAEGKDFEEDLLIVEPFAHVPSVKPKAEGMEALKNALILGLRDYMSKTGFQKAVLGLSGGIDSAVVAALAAEAIGPENVLGIGMPSPYSSEHSVTDAQLLAQKLGMAFRLRPIREEFEAFKRNTGREMAPIAEENIQARIRGNILMEISNSEGHIVLTTGNKSELAVGYCTLYGDMCGGLAVISDVPKTMVYELARHINTFEEIIPWNTINKAPSAELRPDQKDTDSLPPYEVLDEILRLFIEDRKSKADIVANGFEETDVSRILKLVQRNEYKRRQAPMGLKITSKAFGSGRRYVISQGWNFF